MGLRVYQEEDLDKIRQAMRSGAWHILFEASVGYGKSLLIITLAAAYSNAGRSVWVLSNRSAVINQLRNRALGLSNVQVLTVQAADRRRAILASDPAALILIDEAHMGGAAPQYRRVMDCAPNARVIAFTGTPTPELFDVFPCHIQGRGASWLTANGFLSPLRYHRPARLDLSRIAIKNGDYDEAAVVQLLEERRTYGDAIDAFREYGIGVPSISFCVNVKHANKTADRFRDAGHPCEVLVGEDSEKEVAWKLDYIADGGHLLSVDKISAGFDLPDVRFISSQRPTQSEPLWVQQLGRAARANEGKPFAWVADHACNSYRLGSLTEERNWRNLKETQAARLTADGDSLSIRTCDACLATFEAGPACCPFCGEALAKEKRMPMSQKLRMEEVAAAEIDKQRQAAAALRKRQGQTIAQMRAWLGRKVGEENAHRQAVKNMQDRYTRALAKGDTEVAKFAARELKAVNAL